MRHLPRPRSRSFRVALALALLAWTALAFGAPALPMPMPVNHAASIEACAVAETMPSAVRVVHPTSAPAMPAGHGECCHAGCHCLAPFAVGIALAPVSGGSVPPGSARFVLAVADPVVATAAPPLRPPIA